uniref:Uncharacterized protein n=1 Tax=Aegilops tauschii subsp. strangulata TaxID=200361 RepID=A0A452XGX8_AEGTS
ASAVPSQRRGDVGLQDPIPASVRILTAFKPKTWSEIPRLVRERRQATREAKKLRQSMQE